MPDIISRFVGTPAYETLIGIVESQIKAGADICKIVTTARSFEDNLNIIKLIAKFPEAKMVAFAMGDEGRISRIFLPLPEDILPMLVCLRAKNLRPDKYLSGR